MAGFLAALAGGLPLRDAIHHGSFTAAAIVVARVGCAPAMPNAIELDDFLATAQITPFNGVKNAHSPFDNRNRPIVDINHDLVPLNYFNIVKLKAGESFEYRLAEYETCIVPATGTISVETAGQTFKDIGKRGKDVWDGEPGGVCSHRHGRAYLCPYGYGNLCCRGKI